MLLLKSYSFGLHEGFLFVFVFNPWNFPTVSPGTFITNSYSKYSLYPFKQKHINRNTEIRRPVLSSIVQIEFRLCFLVLSPVLLFKIKIGGKSTGLEKLTRKWENINGKSRSIWVFLSPVMSFSRSYNICFYHLVCQGL